MNTNMNSQGDSVSTGTNSEFLNVSAIGTNTNSMMSFVDVNGTAVGTSGSNNVSDLLNAMVNSGIANAGTSGSGQHHYQQQQQFNNIRQDELQFLLDASLSNSGAANSLHAVFEQTTSQPQQHSHSAGNVIVNAFHQEQTCNPFQENNVIDSTHNFQNSPSNITNFDIGSLLSPTNHTHSDNGANNHGFVSHQQHTPTFLPNSVATNTTAVTGGDIISELMLSKQNQPQQIQQLQQLKQRLQLQAASQMKQIRNDIIVANDSNTNISFMETSNNNHLTGGGVAEGGGGFILPSSVVNTHYEFQQQQPQQQQQIQLQQQQQQQQQQKQQQYQFQPYLLGLNQNNTTLNVNDISKLLSRQASELDRLMRQASNLDNQINMHNNNNNNSSSKNNYTNDFNISNHINQNNSSYPISSIMAANSNHYLTNFNVQPQHHQEQNDNNIANEVHHYYHDTSTSIIGCSGGGGGTAPVPAPSAVIATQCINNPRTLNDDIAFNTNDVANNLTSVISSSQQPLFTSQQPVSNNILQPLIFQQPQPQQLLLKQSTNFASLNPQLSSLTTDNQTMSFTSAGNAHPTATSIIDPHLLQQNIVSCSTTTQQQQHQQQQMTQPYTHTTVIHHHHAITNPSRDRSSNTSTQPSSKIVKQATTSTSNTSTNTKPTIKKGKKKDFEFRFQELLQYKEEHGDCMVPHKYPKNPSLGTWVDTQRRRYRKYLAVQKMINKKEDQQPSTDTSSNNGDNYDDVDNDAESNFQTLNAVTYLQSKPGPSTMSEEQVKRLRSIGFIFEPRPSREETWNNRYDELLKFKENHGHCNVREDDRSNPGLGKWVSYIRRSHRLAKQGRRARGKRLSDERIMQLKTLGFVFELKEELAMNRYREGMVQLREFYAKEGHLGVPQFYASNPTFGLCVEDMRKEYRKYARGEKCNLDKPILDELTSMSFLSEEELVAPQDPHVVINEVAHPQQLPQTALN